MTEFTTLAIHLRERFSGVLVECHEAVGEVTIVLTREDLTATCLALRDESAFEFKQLIDVTVVDYLTYGEAEWETQSATSQGFDRGVVALSDDNEVERSKAHFIKGGRLRSERGDFEGPRFAVVYHLLSITNI